ncbi:hypothetical protein [Bradyrhizobium iriomotense]|uniref:Uncharacterized protein n=1 Tax=Bradyrhizobium iriomotense TaxID=441950 RepID=A0ABQ6B9R4_9BRAD|nr:hypothetical protein [Bradyrhizobium iriomotense]GLR90184.1 hypothetical protein GCM10007857_68980 [Bradyrhizobium iriomotense]
MQSTKVKLLGLAAVAAVLMCAVPVERAHAVSLINPGAAQSVQDVAATTTTEVGWHGWHHHHWRWHRWHHRHWW